MPLDTTNIAIRATTQDHLDIEDIQDDLILLKDGSVCLILQTTAVNFGLLSEQEQDATIFAYAGLLNSLTFPIQIVIKSQRKDISSYLKLLKNEEDKQKNPTIKIRIQKYRLFVESTVSEKNVLDKKFYLVIPFSAIELGIKSTGGLFKKGLPFPKNYILERAKTTLSPKRDHLIRQFNRLGLKTEQLSTKKLIELFFKTYNPESIGTQQITETQEYSKPIVEAAIEGSKIPDQTSTPSQTSSLKEKINTPAPVVEKPVPPPLGNLSLGEGSAPSNPSWLPPTPPVSPIPSVSPVVTQPLSSKSKVEPIEEFWKQPEEVPLPKENPDITTGTPDLSQIDQLIDAKEKTVLGQNPKPKE